MARSLALALALQLAGPPAQGQTIPTALSVVNVRGDNALGGVRQRATQDPVIRVVDENQKPIVGAAVVFTLPTEGATGVFGNGLKTMTVLTDSAGNAAAVGLRFNHIPGKVPVHVNVSYKGLTAHSSITEISEAPAGYKPGGGGGNGKVIAILAVLAAGGAGGAYYAFHKSSTPATATPTPPVLPAAIGITPGTGAIAPPR